MKAMSEKRAHYYRDFYGCSASIKPWRGTFVLTARIPQGDIFHKKTYETFRGARIALGKLGEGWEEKISH